MIGRTLSLRSVGVSEARPQRERVDEAGKVQGRGWRTGRGVGRDRRQRASRPTLVPGSGGPVAEACASPGCLCEERTEA